MQSLWKTEWGLLKKLELPHNPTIPLWGTYLDKTNSKKHGTPMFIAALLTTAKTWKQPKCPPTDGWIKVMWGVCLHTQWNTTQP